MTTPIERTSVGPGRERFAIPVSLLASGQQLTIPVLTITGDRPGPRVGVSAMVHGDELEGLLIIRELWKSIDPSQLANASGPVTIQYVEPTDTGPVTIAETSAVLR